MSGELCVMLVAAEASADHLGAELARALTRRLGDKVRFIGVGGRDMASVGVQSPFDIAQLQLIGFFEGLAAYGRVLKLVRRTASLAEDEGPDVAVLIDSWGFTARVAERLRQRMPTLTLIKYVGPQVWGSFPKRARALAGLVDHLLAIHSFEAPYFEVHGLPVTFVGNSALARDFSKGDAARFRARIGAAPDAPILLVLPGSRPSEIERMLPPFEAAVDILKRDRPNLQVVIPAAATVADKLKAAVASWTHAPIIVEDDEAKVDAVKAGTVALACSGTVTAELALAGCPMVIAYRVGKMTAWIMRKVILTKYISLINIAAQRMIAPELLQDDCTGPNLAREIALRLDDPALRERQIAEQNESLDKMGRGGRDPAELAADAVLKVLGERGVLAAKGLSG